MHQVLKKSLIIFLIILFAAIIGWTFLGMSWKEGFSGAAQEKINNMYSANVIFANSIYSIVITDSKNVPIATFYTNPVTLATLSNISSVTFNGESSNSLWSSATATITIDTVGNTYQGFYKYFVVDLRAAMRVNDHITLSLGIDNVNNDRYFLFHPFPQRSYFAAANWKL